MTLSGLPPMREKIELPHRDCDRGDRGDRDIAGREIHREENDGRQEVDREFAQRVLHAMSPVRCVASRAASARAASAGRGVAPGTIA